MTVHDLPFALLRALPTSHLRRVDLRGASLVLPLCDFPPPPGPRLRPHCGFLSGAIPRDRFEKLLEQHCKRVPWANFGGWVM